MNTFFRNLLSLNLLCITLFFTACSKDDDGTNNIDNLATGPIELPVLRQGLMTFLFPIPLSLMDRM